MKILSNTSTDKELKLDIVVELESTYDIAAAIRPVYKEDGSIDQLALAEYNDFVTNVLGLFICRGFEILDEVYSNKSETSMYFTLCKESEFVSENIKFIIFFRISDHDYKEKSREDKKKTERHRTDYFDSKAQEFKKPETKGFQKWKVRNVVVNDTTYNDYDEAYDGIDQMLDKLK